MKLRLRTAVPTAFATVLVTLLVANLGDQQKDIHYQIKELPAVTTTPFTLAMENLLGPPIAHGNKITAYYNGDQIFPPMLDAIRNAKKTINFESYIYLDGKIGSQFVEALSERARAGLKVHLLIDWLGSGKIKRSFIETMQHAGVQVEWYHKPAWYTISRFNNRTHRKILVIDGVVGFTGGVGISDEWLGDARNPGEWRDNHYRVVGPAVGQMQAAFVDNWLSVAPEVLHDETYFPKIKPDGPSEAHVFRSSPREGAASAHLMYLLSLAAAKESIFLSMAYFVPDQLAMEEMIKAIKRGVKIEIIVPGEHSDSKTVLHASRYRYGTMLEAGIKIYEFQPTMYHCKTLIIDRAWTSVGSTNFDDRSLRLNSEANLNILDKNFAASQIEAFEKDKAKSKEIILEEWKNRPFLDKALGWCANLLKTQI